LHAYNLYLVHPVTNEPMNFIAQIPKNFLDFYDKNFNTGDKLEQLNQDFINNTFNSFI